VSFFAVPKEGQMTIPFLSATARVQLLERLFSTLVARTHNVLREEIVSVLYELGCADWQFFIQCIRNLIDTLPTSPDYKQHLFAYFATAPTDITLFRAKVDQFSTDLRFLK